MKHLIRRPSAALLIGLQLLEMQTCAGQQSEVEKQSATSIPTNQSVTSHPPAVSLVVNDSDLVSQAQDLIKKDPLLTEDGKMIMENVLSG